MPRVAGAVPTYRKLRASGRAVVTLGTATSTTVIQSFVAAGWAHGTIKASRQSNCYAASV